MGGVKLLWRLLRLLSNHEGLTREMNGKGGRSTRECYDYDYDWDYDYDYDCDWDL